jgi:hypothetical protein
MLARRLATSLACVAAACASAPVAADAQNALPRNAASETEPPEGFTVSAAQARALAERTEAVAALRRRNPRVLNHPVIVADGWEVRYGPAEDKEPTLIVEVAGNAPDVLAIWKGPKAAWSRARGDHSTFAKRVHWIVLGLSLCMLLPFVPRSRRELLRFADLAALAWLAAWYVLLDAGALNAAVVSAWPAMLWLLGRMLAAGFGRKTASALRLPSFRLVAGGALGLLALRTAYNLEWSVVSDVGYAGVFKANSIHHGWPIYSDQVKALEAYGPVAYLAYLPFELIFPMQPDWQRDSLPAAHAAAIAFDWAAAGGLFVLGRRFFTRDTGAALAYGWAACPVTLLPLALNTNDALVAALVIWTLVAMSSPALRGVIAALAIATKFAPAILLPLLARVRERSIRPIVIFGAAVAGTLVVAIVPYLPESGIGTFYDSTIGWAADRPSPFSVWGLYPSIDPGVTVIRSLVVLLACAVFFVPRERGPFEICALSAALLIGSQLGTRYWSALYAAWFVGPALVAVLAARAPAREPSRIT